MVKVDGKTHFVYSDSELSKLTGAKGKKTKIDEDFELLELFEVHDIEPMIKKIEKFGIDIDTYFSKDYGVPSKSETKKQPIFRIKTEKEVFECDSLIGVLRIVQNHAKKGMHIQRYKGLGEMNPHQLWETTMDPEKRTVLQVKLEDAVEAEKTFSVLMGSEVVPRREFIENEAHKVKNLDV